MNHFDDIGKLILRLSVGILLLMHGLFKLIHGIAGISALIQANGWPAWIAYGVYIGEIIAPALLILGLLTRASAVVIVLNMLLAVYLAHALNKQQAAYSTQLPPHWHASEDPG